MRTLLLLACLATTALPVHAKELVLTLLAGEGPHNAGRPVRVEIAGMNPGARDVPFSLGPTLTGTVVALADGRSSPIEFRSVGGFPATVPAGGFAVRRFEVTLPAGLAGEVILKITAPDTSQPPLRAVLAITGTAVAKNESASTTASDATVASSGSSLDQLAASAPASAALMRSFGGRFLPNQPIYFLYGDADQAAKFQFSFDYRLATMTFGPADRESVATLRLGYTQRSVWDIDAQSSPFYDTSYMPEIAIATDAPMPTGDPGWFTWLGWRASLLHESNGREGDASRSVNTVYFRPRFILGKLGNWAFVMLPEIQAYLGDSSDNADLKNYRGHGKLRFYFGHNDRPTLMFTGWSGKDFDHGSYQLDLAVPLRLRWLKLESYFYVQYFNGYGESLRDYSLRSDSLRAGFGLVR